MNSVAKAFFFISSLYIIRAEVPVFTWSNKVDLRLPQVFAGHSKSQEEFSKEYLSTGPSNVLLFVQNEISITDILINGGVYGSSEGSNYEQLKSMMEHYISAYMPAVEKPVQTILKKADEENFVFKKLLDGMVEEEALKKELSEMNSQKRRLVLVDFTEFAGMDQKEIDSFIGIIIKHFMDSKQYFHAFYTAKHDNQADMEVVVVGASEASRHLLANADAKTTQAAAASASEVPLSDGNFILWFDYLSINTRVTNTSLKLDKTKVVKNDCRHYNSSEVTTNADCSVVLSMGSLTPFGNIQLELAVVTSGKANAGFWYVRQVVMTYDKGTSEDRHRVNMLGGLTDPTPLGFSYSCNQAPPMTSMVSVNDTDKTPPVELFFHGLQLEVFARNPPYFGYYNDCVGFFSTAIWMFLISAAILVAILFFGLSMLASINTMDRYDDPKGKTITVANTD